MDFEFNENQLDLQKMVRELAEKEIGPRAKENDEKDIYYSSNLLCDNGYSMLYFLPGYLSDLIRSTGKFYSFKDIGIYLSYDFCGICSYRIFCSGIKVKGNYRSRASKVSKRTSACQNGKEK